MGLSPRQVDEMMLWEYEACVEAHNEANSAPADPEPMSNEEFDDFVAQVDARMGG